MAAVTPVQGDVNRSAYNMPFRYGAVLEPGWQMQLVSNGDDGPVLGTARDGNVMVGVVLNYDGTSYDRFIGGEGSANAPTHICTAVRDTLQRDLANHYLSTTNAGNVAVVPLEIGGMPIVAWEDSVGGAIASAPGKYVNLANGTDVIVTSNSPADFIPTPEYNIYIDSSTANASQGSLKFLIGKLVATFIDSAGVTHSAYYLTRVA